MREEALALLKRYNESESLVRHGLAVEAIMRHFAAQAGEDVEYWGAVGLLHDVDYERYPESTVKSRRTAGPGGLCGGLYPRRGQPWLSGGQ